MSSELEKLKAGRQKHFDELKRYLEFERETERSLYRSRIFDALKDTQDGLVMKNCLEKSGPACGSVFCDKCRKKKQQNLLGSYRDYVRETFGDDDDVARERLRWVSVLHSVVSVKHETADEERDTIAEVERAVADMKLNLSNIAEQQDGSTRLICG